MNFGKSQLRWTHTEMKEKIARHTRPMGYKIIKLIYFELLSDKHGAQCTILHMQRKLWTSTRVTG